MKKIILLLFVAISLNYSSTMPITFAKNEYYAKIPSEGVYFFSSPSDENEVFELPASYFVLIQGVVGEFYQCAYSDLMGYVKKSDVEPMNGTPKTPYVNFASLRVFSLTELGLYSSPYKISRVTYSVPGLASGVNYYGKIFGDDLVPGKTNLWYYCKYNDNEGVHFGYLYSAFCDELTSIPTNNESFDLITAPLFEENTKDRAIRTLSSTAKTLIVVGVSLPCALLIYLLIKPTLLTNGHKQQKAKTKVKKRKCDYFEFNENDIS